MSVANDNDTIKITDAVIAQRAYEIWESKGRPEDDGSDNWQVAKLQLLAETEQAPCTSTQRGPLLRFFDRIRNRAAL